MRTTLNINDELLAEAQRVNVTTEKPKLVREALRALIERENAPPRWVVSCGCERHLVADRTHYQS